MAKGAPEPQGGGGGDRSLDFFWTVGAIVAIVLLVWYFEKKYIAMAIFQMKLYEILAADFVMAYWEKLALFLHFPMPDLSDLSGALSVISGNYGSVVEFGVLNKLSVVVGGYLKFPAMFVLFCLGVLLYRGGISQKYRTTYSMELLKKSERNNWPQYSPVMQLDLVAADLSQKPWAIAYSPMRFCKKYNLLNEEIDKNGKRTVSLRQGAAYRVLSLQLGPRWRGVKVLPDYLQALFAIFTARINGDKKVADTLMDKISASSSSGKLDFDNARELALKYANTKSVQRIVNVHGYVVTVMASLLVASREAGVLSTAEFIWLKASDRRIWYILNSVGRYTSVAEIAGAFSHWLAEKKLGLPLMVPMVEEAVKGLEVAIGEVLYKPEEEEEEEEEKN